MKRYCPRGHDKEAEGAYGSVCRRCARDRSVARNRARRQKRPSPFAYRFRLPAAPLVAAIDEWMAVGRGRSTRSLARRYADRFGVSPEASERFFARLRVQATVTVDQGDQVAVALGLHPVMVWPVEWEAAG